MITTVHDLLDPLTGQRRSVQFAGSQLRAPGPDTSPANGRDIDGSSWWILPALYDADAHMPLLQAGLRRYDLTAALFGGVHHFNVALPWQLIRSRSLGSILTETAGTSLPRITLQLSVSPAADSAGFADWLAGHRSEVRELLAPVCKLHTVDPHFERNIEAVWTTGLKPAVFCYTWPDLLALVDRAHAPLHFRHATSAAMIDAIRAVPGATLQTSPHMLLPLAIGRRDALSVLPKPPADADRESLARRIVTDVDVIASDHVSPALGPQTGPGLQTQQHFISALLTACALYGWEIADIWPKVTTAPAEVFGIQPADGFVVVDPEAAITANRWPRQADDRAPYLGLELRGRVIAVGSAQMVELV
jgi:hypothetical protein